MAAAVADWHVANASGSRSRRTARAASRSFSSPKTRHPGLDQPVAAGRPDLVVGFAAGTDNVLENASAKRLRKAATGSWPMT